MQEGLDVFGQEQFLTFSDFPSSINPNELESINGHPNGDIDKQNKNLLNERLNLDELLDRKDVVIVTKTSQPIFKTDSYRDICGRPNMEVNLFVEVPIEDQRVMRVATAITGKRDGKYRSGYLSNLIVAQRYIDEEGKWSQKDNRKPYRLLTKAEYSFIGRRDGKRIIMSFDEGSIVWMPENGELKMNRQDKMGLVKKIKLGLRRN